MIDITLSRHSSIENAKGMTFTMDGVFLSQTCTLAKFIVPDAYFHAEAIDVLKFRSICKENGDVSQSFSLANSTRS